MAKSNPPKAAKATKAVKTADDTAPRAPTFDAKANVKLRAEERAARATGQELKLGSFTVAPGKSVRQGGERYMEGAVIKLSASDGERLLARGIVLKGAAGADAVAARAAEVEAQRKAAEEAEEAQRKADEKAAATKAAADEAAGRDPAAAQK